MKKLAIAFAAIAAFTAPGLAADMPARAPVYQPPAPVYNWTGFWISGGGGGGLWNADSNVVAFPGGLGGTRDRRLGGSRLGRSSWGRHGMARKPILAAGLLVSGWIAGSTGTPAS